MPVAVCCRVKSDGMGVGGMGPEMEIREPSTEARRMRESHPQGPAHVLCTEAVLQGVLLHVTSI